MKLIVAVDNEWGIGNKGDLLSRVRGDLLHFRDVTAGKTVVLGSNTLATFPGGKVLKNRVNIVLHPSESYSPEGALVAHSIPELLDMLKSYDTNDVFAIGGASVYRQLLPYCDTAYVTKFRKSYEKDVWFENLDESPEWELCEESGVMHSDPEKDTDPALDYVFCVYRRVAPAVTVREANPEDVPAIYRLLTVIADVHRAIRPDLMLDKKSKYTPEEVRAHIGDGTNFIFVAEREGEVCGHIMCVILRDAPKTLYIDDLCVDPAARRKGVARKLMRRAEAFGKENGCSYLLLSVWSGNGEAERFYADYGMTERSRNLEKRI